MPGSNSTALKFSQREKERALEALIRQLENLAYEQLVADGPYIAAVSAQVLMRQRRSVVRREPLSQSLGVARNQEAKPSESRAAADLAGLSRDHTPPR